MDTVQFVTYIAEHEGVDSEFLSRHFGVSTRTLRSYALRANDVLCGCATVELVRGRGYRVHVADPEAFAAWRAKHSSSDDSLTCKTPDERVGYLLNDLLMRTDWITLAELSKVLFVSKSALSGDLKKVEEHLAPYGLLLERKSHYGIRVTGSEMSRRLCLANAAVEAREANVMRARDIKNITPPPTLKAIVGDAFENADQLLNLISTCVNEALHDSGLTINAVAFNNLLVHLAIALVRISEDCYVPIEDERLERIAELREFEVARDIAGRITQATSLKLPREEIAYIAIHLAGKQTVYQSPDSENLIISDEVWRVVSNMLERVWRVFRFDFRTDLELRMNLARHIQPLSVRLRYNLKLKNPLLDDIKARYPLAFSIAVDASSEIAETYGSVLSHDEIGYIALAFELALERSRIEIAKKNILVVCASGAGSARLLEYQCRREFGDYIDRIETCDVFGLDEVDFAHIDYAFTTVPLDRELPVPVREVSQFLDPVEAEKTRVLLRQGLTRRSATAQGFIDERLFFSHLAVETKEEAMGFLIDQAERVRHVSPRFRALVLDREERMSTAFGNNIALPHPLEVASDETFICVGILDKPIAWDEEGTRVQAVFLSAFASNEGDGGKEARAFLDRFAGVLANPQAIGALVEQQTWEVFVELLGDVGIAT